MLTLLQVLPDAARMHAISVHFPIVLVILAPLLVIALAFYRGKHDVLRWTAVAAYGIALVMTIVAVQAGEAAIDKAAEQLQELPDEVSELAHSHEEMGEKLWIFILLAGTLVGLTHLDKPKLRIGCLIGAIVIGLAGAGWVAATAHQGGELVYGFGVGTP